MYADIAGNTLALIAAALIPILAMIGGGVDMGRSYLSQSRLQQACDSGVLAARKVLGTQAAVTGTIPTEVNEIGHQFFESNFNDRAYGTEKRTFQMTLEGNYAISGRATVSVPTTVMAIFGFEQVPVAVTCESQLNMSNTDIMMVLDVTGSMNLTNDGDDMNRMDTMKDTVRSFHAQLTTGAATSATRIRFGFVPYSTNVNVGHLLEDDWVADKWQYQSRKWELESTVESTRTYWKNRAQVSGTKTESVEYDSYEATWHPPGGGGGGPYLDENENLVYPKPGKGYYTCDTSPPENSYTRERVEFSYAETPFAGPPPGVQKRWRYRTTENGAIYWLRRTGSTCQIMESSFNDYVYDIDKVEEPTYRDVYKWHYRQMNRDVSDWRSESNGCIEERETYEITDYSNVNLNRALDLDIDLVPSAGNPKTQWKPMYPDIVYARSKRWDNTGDFTTKPVWTYDDYIAPDDMGVASCPAQARNLAEISSEELDDYLALLTPVGQTYHDIGMIWGGRLLSPTGLFAAENADVSSSRPTSRHLIFLTDGQTAPLDVAYSSYGVEPIDQRRWNEKLSRTLKETVEERFKFACEQVRNRNITVWIVAFGTDVNDAMTTCSGEGRYFAASNAEQLNAAFAKIAKSIAELRITG